MQCWPCPAALPPDVKPWLDASAQHSFFCSEAWWDLLSRHGFEPETAPFWLELTDSLWPLAADHYQWSGLKLPRWRALANCYSSFYQPAGQITDHSLDELHQAAVNANQAILELWPLSESCGQRLQQGLSQRGWHSTLYPLYGNWQQSLPASFADYWQQRPSRLRNTLQRRYKKLQQIEHQFELVQHPDQLESAIAAFNRLYQQRWGQQELQPDFVPALIRHLAQHQQLRLGFLTLGSQRIAAQLWIVEHKRALMYKVAYDETYSQYSPGSQLLRWMIEYLMQQDKIQVLDFLTGDDPYKADWLTEREQRYGLQAVRWRHLPGILLASRNQLAHWLRPFKNFVVTHDASNEKPHESTTSN